MLRSDRGGGGHPHFNGWPNKITDEYHTGFITYSQQEITANLHWRHDSSNYDLFPVDHLSDGAYSDGQSLNPNNTKHKVFANQYVSNNRWEDDWQHLVNDKEDHFIRDYNDPSSISMDHYKASKSDRDALDRRLHYETNMDFGDTPVFSGSTTHVNPYDDSEKNVIIEQGLEQHEIMWVNDIGFYRKSGGVGTPKKLPPISPLHPFTRMEDPKYARESVFTTYNRAHIPVADLEFRKAFRHTFINRPECYVMYKNGGQIGLCEQAKFDEDFSSLYTRLPHLVELMAPTYVSGTFGKSSLQDNWNYLLSNRIISISTPSEQLSLKESTTKSTEGITISPGLHFDSRAGSTLSITFRDTKYFEVYEFIKAWMLYIHKRERGVFLPSYNGYQYNNDFATSGEVIQMAGISDAKIRGLHPYDRALEYCTSIFDFITDESDTNIKTWYKYYGVFPIGVSTSISSENGAAITGDMRVEVTFRYQYKLEGVNKNLVEFNFNSGIVDALGNQTKEAGGIIESSMPFWYKDSNAYGPSKSGSGDGYFHHRVQSKTDAMTQYIGASGLFAGTPFILMTLGMPHPLSASGNKPNASADIRNMVIPTLRFSAIKSDFLNSRINLGFENVRTNYGVLEYAQTSSNVQTETEETKQVSQLTTPIDYMTLSGLGEEIVNEIKDIGNNFIDNFHDNVEEIENNKIFNTVDMSVDAVETVLGSDTTGGKVVHVIGTGIDLGEKLIAGSVGAMEGVAEAIIGNAFNG